MSGFLYRSFWVGFAARRWIERRFTRAGVFVLGALVAAAILGLDTNQSVAYQAFTLLLALLAVSMALSVRFRPRVEVERVMPRLATAGDPFAYRLVVRNRTPRVQRGLRVQEELADPRPGLQEFRAIRAPGEERQSWFDRAVGFRRWEWLLLAKGNVAVEEQPVPVVTPNGEADVRAWIAPRHRGYLRFTGVTIARPDPLGVAKASVSRPLPQSVLVLPRRYALPPFQLPGTRKYQHGGMALASSVGDSEEFMSLRDYRPGDPWRRIHWRSSARLAKPVVKEYQDEFFVRHGLVLDTFADAEHSEAFEEAVSVAASFASSIQTQESLLDLMFVGPEAYCFTAGRGLSRVEKMLEILACARPCRGKEFRELHHLVVGRCAALSGCICVLLGWDRDRQGFVAHLRGLGLPVLVLVITDGSRPGPTGPGPEEFRRLEVGKIAEGLARL